MPFSGSAGHSGSGVLHAGRVLELMLWLLVSVSRLRVLMVRGVGGLLGKHVNGASDHGEGHELGWWAQQHEAVVVHLQRVQEIVQDMGGKRTPCSLVVWEVW